MKYLCLICVEEQLENALSSAERDELVKEHLDHDDELRAQGHYVTSAALERRFLERWLRELQAD